MLDSKIESNSKISEENVANYTKLINSLYEKSDS